MIYMCPSFMLKDYTQRNIFGILLNQTEIRLYLPFSDRFETKRTSVWCLPSSACSNIIYMYIYIHKYRCRYL